MPGTLAMQAALMVGLGLLTGAVMTVLCHVVARMFMPRLTAAALPSLDPILPALDAPWRDEGIMREAANRLWRTEADDAPSPTGITR